MNIYSMPLDVITFKDVVSFCDEKIPEGVTLEYKEDFPKDLAKQFVSFSNTQGGLIIIGIQEDKNGLPIAAPGVALQGKLDDRVHNIAGNVTPLPSYQVAVTNEVKSRVFVLIRIFEGTAPPYATQQNPTPLLRTGNVTKPLTQANREELLALMNKQTKAEEDVNMAFTIAARNYEVDLQLAEDARLQLLKKGEANIYKYKLGPSEVASIFSVNMIPTFPGRKLFTYDDLREPHVLLGGHLHNTAFTHTTTSVPGGITAFKWSKNGGHFSGSQLYLSGQWYNAGDVLRVNDKKPRVSTVMLSGEIKGTLDLARRLYGNAGYNGGITLKFSLNGGKGASVVPPLSSGWGDDYGKIRDNEYAWEYTTDTQHIKDKDLSRGLHIMILKDISWSLGVKNNTDTAIGRHFEANGWYK